MISVPAIKPNRPIGVFDSGIGGLTVLKELVDLLPGEEMIYLGDTARVPYGVRSPETIVRYSEENVLFLMNFGVKLIVVACNTSSAIALPKLQRKFSFPILGVVEAGARAAVETSRSGRIGVLGTEATVRSGAYAKYILTLNPRAKVSAVPCPLFVPLAEEGWVGDKVARLTAENYLRDLKSRTPDVVLLGCTHYPLLKGVIQKVMGPRVRLIDSAVETAREVKELLDRTGLAREKDSGRLRFYVTDNPEKFRRVGEKFFRRPIAKVSKVSLR